jgi:hypothetical protein
MLNAVARLLVVLGVVLTLALVGCEKKKETPPPKAPSSRVTLPKLSEEDQEKAAKAAEDAKKEAGKTIEGVGKEMQE